MAEPTKEDTFYTGLTAKKEEPPKKEETPPVPRMVTERNLFGNPDSHPVLLDTALLKEFGVEWFAWLADTLFYEIEQTFKTSIADVNKLKIMTVKTLHVSDAFWEQWEIFEKTINALNGIPPMLEVMQPPDVAHMLTGCDIAAQVRKEEFSEQVSRYGAACFLHDNVHYAPEPCAFVQPFISQPMYKCRDCGKVGSALPPFDGHCASCSLKFDGEHPFSFKPDPKVAARGFGRNLDYSLTYDPTPVKKRFEELDALPPSEVGNHIREESDDIQAAKLIVATDYKNYRSRQLAEQLVGLRGWLEQA